MSTNEDLQDVCYRFIEDKLERSPQNEKWFRGYYPNMELNKIEELSRVVNETKSTLILTYGFGFYKVGLFDIHLILLEEGEGAVLQKVFQAAA